MVCDERSDHLQIPGYEILRPIGRGGMGEVYLARQLSLGRSVALKILTMSAKTDPVEQAARFRREAELMARVHHPNVVSVHDFGTTEGRPYLIMEYVEGGDLRRRMEPGRPLPIDQVRPLISPVTEALACLHAHGILHRDLKPENILMPHDAAPKVTDFGLAVLDSDAGLLTQADQALGTLGYVAPEQQYRLGIDERTDQYSMAALMYELLTGHRPLGIVKPATYLNPGLGRGVDAVLMRGLQEDPDDRYPTIRDFGEALGRTLSTPAVRPRLRLRLRPFPAALAIAALLAMVAGAAVYWGRAGRPVAPGGILVTARPPETAPAPVAPRLPDPVAPPTRLIQSLRMTLVLIPAGEFMMGSPAGDAAAKKIEKPSHRVKISRPFYLGKTEVTVGQFRAFVAATGYRTEAELSPQGGSIYSKKAQGYEWSPRYNWRNPGLAAPQGPDEPVVQVTWNDAMAFCDWLSDRDGRPYRLPTEAEWEYACRAGSTTRWCMGDDPGELDAFAWYKDPGKTSTHPVGLKKSNAFGLCDMHGNVWEWCLDWCEPYRDGPMVVDPVGPPSGRMRVLRGGTFTGADVDRTSSATRMGRKPSAPFFKFGFRVCCPLESEAGGD